MAALGLRARLGLAGLTIAALAGSAAAQLPPILPPGPGDKPVAPGGKPTMESGRAAMFAAMMKQVGEAKTRPTPRAADGKPDLNGLWVGPGGFFMSAEKKGQDVIVDFPDYGKGGRRPMPADGPKYKPGLMAKVDYNDINEPVTDKVFQCGRAGVPRIGAPQQIVQTGKNVVLLYTDVAGETFRDVPTDGRGFRDEVDASYNGDSVGHWDGDTLVIETKNFVDDSWFGERGYFHTDQMSVVEKLSRQGDALTWTATVTDPGVLLEPWTTTRTVVLSKTRLEEPPPCNDIATGHLVNHDNHQQR